MKNITAILLFVFCCINSFAQQKNTSTYILKGTVLDSASGSALPIASLYIKETKQALKTDAEGQYKFKLNKKGTYTLQVNYLGYHPSVFTIKVDTNIVFDVPLPKEIYHLHEFEIYSHRDDFFIGAKSIITLETIERNRGQNFVDLIKNIPGITSLSTGPGLAKPVIRGLHSNRVVTLNNDIRLEDQQWGADHGTGIDPFAVGNIEIIKGAASLQYGAEAIGGVVKISPRAYAKNKGIQGEYLANVFSNNRQVSNSILLEGNHLKEHELKWKMQTSYIKAGDAQTANYVMNNTSFNELNFSSSIQHNFKRLTTEISYTYYQSEIGILKSSHIHNQTDLMNVILYGSPLVITPYSYTIGRPKLDVMHQVFAIKLQYQMRKSKINYTLSNQTNNRKEYDVLASWNNNAYNQNLPAYDLTLNTWQQELKYENMAYKNWIHSMGLNWIYQGNYAEGKQFFVPNFIANSYGVFALSKYAKKRWQLDFGLRYDIRNQTKYVNQNKQILSSDLFFESISFASGVAYQVLSKWKLNANIGSAWRAPSINELYADGLHAALATYEKGNVNLQAERCYNFELGIKHQNKNWQAEITAFSKYINNYIYKLPTHTIVTNFRGSFPLFEWNQTDAIIHGIELLTDYQLHKNFSASASANFLYANDIKNNSPLIFIPANRSKFGITFQTDKLGLLQHFFATVNCNIVAQQYRYVANLDWVAPPSAYVLCDINTGFELVIKKQHLKLSFGVQNLFDNAYRDYLSRYRYFSLDPGRNFIIRLTIPFNILSIN